MHLARLMVLAASCADNGCVSIVSHNYTARTRHLGDEMFEISRILGSLGQIDSQPPIPGAHADFEKVSSQLLAVCSNYQFSLTRKHTLLALSAFALAGT